MNTRPAAPGAVAPASTRRRFLGTVAAGLGGAGLFGLLPRVGTSAPPAPTGKLPTALVFDSICKTHLPDATERECPKRFDAIVNALKATDYFASLRAFKPRPATDQEVLACHTTDYVALARKEIEAGATRLSTGDTFLCRESLKAAYWASGAACTAVDAVLSGQAKNAFCLTRPPGHHATPNRGMGFCIFNNVSIAARYAQRKHGIGKVLIVDWDVHHGNGTQEIFYEDPSVFFFDTHQSPWYPRTGAADETGRGKGVGLTINVPLTAGAGRKEFWSAYQDKLAPAVARFKPELVILSAGFDARHGDPLGRLELVDQDYIDLTGLLLEITRPYAQNRFVSVLEGGYSLAGVSAAAAAHCGRLQRA